MGGVWGNGEWGMGYFEIMMLFDIVLSPSVSTREYTPLASEGSIISFV